MCRDLTIAPAAGLRCHARPLLAFIFARRDWEHAVGAHYAINLVPWLMALLAT